MGHNQIDMKYFQHVNSAKRTFLIFGLIGILSNCQTEDVVKNTGDSFPVYRGHDLGLTFKDAGMEIKVWSPRADSMVLRIYDTDEDSHELQKLDLIKNDTGIWYSSLPNKYMGLYYTLQAQHGTKWSTEVPDPYVKATGRNGKRGQFLNPAAINPTGWESDRSPELKSAADIVIYELHIRDFSVHPESGMTHKGKYLAFTERGTTTPDGIVTGVDHLVDLGITHVHLLPSFDFMSIDESKPDIASYNWGYDPQNYNVPEGSYASDAADGAVRILEFKAMVQALHDAGIRVIMDVVYNHTGRTDGLAFEELVPGYYYRHRADGTFSNASGCGNEMASEKPMMRKFMVESLKYWMDEYHIDGFRFDLMAIHDQETMRTIEQELHAIRPDVFLYGEGWTADESPLPKEDRSLKMFTYKLPNIAAFSDEMRDGIKGHWHDHTAKGFASGNTQSREAVKFGVVGAVDHPDINYDLVNEGNPAWATDPVQCIGYVSCHDNHTLYDKLKIANPDADEASIRKMHILSNTIVLTSQSIPFLHAGVEFMRTKQGVENSYQSPDSINQIDWSSKSAHPDLMDHYKSLIVLRKDHPVFNLGKGDEVRERLHFLDSDAHLLAYRIAAPEDDSWSDVVIVFNGSDAAHPLILPEGEWQRYSRDLISSTGATMAQNQIVIPSFDFAILYKERKAL